MDRTISCRSLSVNATYVCMYISVDWKPQLTELVAPNNFRIAQRAPQIGDTFSLLRRVSDTSGETGLALMDSELFLEWNCKGKSKDLLNTRLQAGGSINGSITSSESFFWGNGGGNCFRGGVTIN